MSRLDGMICCRGAGPPFVAAVALLADVAPPLGVLDAALLVAATTSDLFFTSGTANDLSFA
mgnify:CR=1 FL=1